MQAVTPGDYEAAIRATTGADLKLLLLESMDLHKNRNTYHAHFGNATQSFVDACQAIVQRESDSRLSKLIHVVFREARLESELSPPSATTP